VNGKDLTRTDHIGHREFTSKGPVLLGACASDNPNDRWRDLNGALAGGPLTLPPVSVQLLMTHP
jgi:hypothetical protein